MAASSESKSELYVFARFHAREGMEEKLTAAMRAMLLVVRTEPGCIAIEVFPIDSRQQALLLTLALG